MDRRIGTFALFFAIIGCPLCSAQPLDFIFHAPQQQELIYDNVTGVGSGSLELVIEEDATNPGFPSSTVGFAMGIEYDGGFVTLIEAEPIGVLAEINDGDGPDFFGEFINPQGVPGFAVGVVYSLGSDDIQFFQPEPVILLDFETIADNLAGSTDDFPVPLVWCDCLGNPGAVVFNSIVVAGANQPLSFEDGSLLLVPLVGPPFLRGDADGSGEFMGLVDGLFILTWNFQGGPEPPCLVAADSDGDEILNGLVDALYLLAHQFGGGPPPPAPYPNCGPDPDPATSLGCAVSTCP